MLLWNQVVECVARISSMLRLERRYQSLGPVMDLRFSSNERYTQGCEGDSDASQRQCPGPFLKEVTEARRLSQSRIPVFLYASLFFSRQSILTHHLAATCPASAVPSWLAGRALTSSSHGSYDRRHFYCSLVTLIDTMKSTIGSVPCLEAFSGRRH